MKNDLYNSRYAVCKSGYTENIDNKDCAVRAIANAMRIDYQDAFDLLEKHGRKPGQGTSAKTIYDSLMTFPNVTIFGAFGSAAKANIRWIGEKEENVKLYTGITVKRFARSVRSGTYILLTTQHALVVRDGEIIGNKYEQLGAHVGLVYKVN